MRGFDTIVSDIYSNLAYQGRQLYPTKPFFLAALTEDDDVIREDILNRWRAHYENNATRIERMRLNLCTYAGLSYFGNDIKTAAVEGLNPALVGRTSRITSNHIQLLINQQVTYAVLYPNEVAVVPYSTDFKSRIAAESVKEILDSQDYDSRKRGNLEILHRRARIFGESYRWFSWNPDKGPEHAASSKARKQGKPVKVMLPDGTEIEVRRQIYLGDVDEDLPYSWDIGLDPKTYPGACEWCFRQFYRPTDELLVDYPDKKDEISITDNAKQWSTELMASTPLADHTLCIEFVHRSTPYLPDGYRALITADCLLESGPNDIPDTTASQFGNLPIERLTDLDIDGHLYGVSRIQNVDQQQVQYNNAQTTIGRNIFIGSTPKWMMPKGACNINRLGNKATVVQFSGAMAPQLVSFPTVPAETFTYKQQMKEEMQELYGVHDISLGKPPPGVTANAALQFLSTQQEDANSLYQAKNEQLVLDSYAKRLAVCAQNYEKGDARVARILGPDKKWYTRVFDPAVLDDRYEFRMAISSDLPKRKDALMQTVVQMSQVWPTLFPPEAVVDMFKLGHLDKFISAGRAAHQSAEYENYRASLGDKIEEPEDFEEVTVHWRSHIKHMQSAQFREWPKDRQKLLINHTLATEYKMLKKSRANFLFAQTLQQLTGWPMLLPLPPDYAGAAAPQMAAPANPGGRPGQPQPQPNSQAMPTGDPTANQQRTPDGTFGEGIQPVMQ